MGESQIHYTKSKGYVLYDSIFEVPGKGKSIGTANRSSICQGLDAGGEGVTTKWYEGTFDSDGKVLHLDCHVATSLYTFAKIDRNVHPKRVDFTVYKLYLSNFKTKQSKQKELNLHKV